MKLYKILYLLLVMVFAVSCAKDKGNYNYEKEIIISVKNLSDRSGQSLKPISILPDIYVIEGKDTVDIFIQSEPISNPNDEKYKLNTDLTFSWEVMGEQVSTEMNFDKALEGVGDFYARYVVTVNKTGINYYFPFYIKLTSPYAAGYFAYARMEDQSSILTFKSTREGEEEEPVISVDNINGVSFGSNPVFLGVRGTMSGPNSYSNYKLFISSANSGPDAKTIITDLLTFDYLGFMDRESVVGGLPETSDFLVQANLDETFFIVDGKAHKGSKGAVQTPSAKKVDYYLAPWVGTGGSFVNTCFVGFDNKNGRFLHFITDVSDPVSGIIADANALDKVTELVISSNGTQVPGFTSGHKLIGGGWYGRNPLTQKAITFHNNQLYFYTFIQNWDVPAFHVPAVCNFEGSITIPGANENSIGRLHSVSYDWYIAAGNKIFKSSSEFVQTYKEEFSLPAASGDIVAMELITKYVTELVRDPLTGVESYQEVAKNCALVATYNSQATGDKKGSLYVINFTDANLMEEYPNCTGKTVKLFYSLMN